MTFEPRLLAGYFSGLTGTGNDAHGDFVLGDLHPINGWALSSTVQATPWYWAISKAGGLIQGANVFALCEAAGLEWEWNKVAISQIALFGHTLGLHTLHKKIFRLPVSTKIMLKNGSVQFQPIDPISNWEWDVDDLDQSFASLGEAFLACVGSSVNPILSLSAGFDSRVLLALCLKFECRPQIFSMGSSAASDVKIAKLLANIASVPVEQIELDPGDYLKYGEDISRATSGAKTASDWHTWLYSKRINDKSRVHLVGSNGEFARTFYYDSITRSYPFRKMGRLGLKPWIAARALNRLRKLPIHLWLAKASGVADVINSVSFDNAKYSSDTLDCLDIFYATERVHHFIGSGLACYSQFTLPRSPFLHKKWMKSIAALRRIWKKENRYHRVAIEKIAPQLLDIPFNQDPDGSTAIGYSPFKYLVQSKEVEETIIESRHLDFFLKRDSRIVVMRDSTSDRSDIVSLLLTMHFSGMCAHRLGRN